LITPLFVTGVFFGRSNNEIAQHAQISIYSTSLDPHMSISINGNDAFNDTAIAEGWIGNGTEINPFIIEGYIFESDQKCISIQNTAYHFIIRNCEFTTAGGSDNQYALIFHSVSNGVIDACKIHDKIGGISVYQDSALTHLG
jgi:hypothetical protein